MTSDRTASPTSAAVIDACAHVDAAAQLLTTSAADEYDPRPVLAGQLRLIAAAIQPGIQAPPVVGDPLGAIGHLDQALRLLSDSPVPADVGVWRLELAELRASVQLHDRGANGVTQ